MIYRWLEYRQAKYKSSAPQPFKTSISTLPVLQISACTTLKDAGVFYMKNKQTKKSPQPQQKKTQKKFWFYFNW